MGDVEACRSREGREVSARFRDAKGADVKMHARVGVCRERVPARRHGVRGMAERRSRWDGFMTIL